ncbi:unnamed protein product, partial [Closterium sp. NIES-65]
IRALPDMSLDLLHHRHSPAHHPLPTSKLHGSLTFLLTAWWIPPVPSTPPPLPQVPELYQMSLDFFRTTASNLPTIHALAAAAAPGGTAGASEAVEGEVQQLERVCASNATALFVAHRAGAGSVLKASFEFAAHPFFPVVTLKRA